MTKSPSPKSRVILIDEDIRDLTGYNRPTEQKRWLDMHGIKYAIRKDGSLSTTIDLINAGLQASTVQSEPDFGALRGKG